MTDRAEALLIAADRAQHMAEVVRAGAGGRTGRGQRPLASTRRWPTRATGEACRWTRCAAVSDWAIDGCWPDLVVLLDVDPVFTRR